MRANQPDQSHFVSVSALNRPSNRRVFPQAAIIGAQTTVAGRQQNKLGFWGSVMRNTIAVMNTKGGVGKSTIVSALAETLAAHHGLNVLVIDSDSQSTVSSMLMTVGDLFRLQQEGRTIVDFLVANVFHGKQTNWSDFVVSEVSDIDDARSVFVIPSDMQLTLFEREVSKESLHNQLRTTIASTLEEIRQVFDVVLIDCPPGLSILTESWLREADYHISPTKADYVSICGLEVFRRFKSLNPELGFAKNLGVVINMKDPESHVDDEYIKWLRDDPENRCFQAVIPRVNALQEAARFQREQRSYGAKFPGIVGQSVRALATEVVERIKNVPATASPPPAKPQEPEKTPTAPVAMPVTDPPPSESRTNAA